ncbi:MULTISPECIES: serine hydrolase domain-containing protein [Lacticaseibacillus]|uniref:Serine hydrolase n=2 Tax=Lacticaseibacillus TaxID=2759736 RepID=A0AAN1C7Y0_LACCA|nr:MULTISPECIES: serine hydrolase domain-containing protein [Lacticaseibacillus]ARY91269.1 serine hydrolase [Lacticaseibacillus casei]KAB1968416.1 beta-lactamase family protein [Lacticaseibacillus casei]WLV81887.1 serine hydrolase domain-containing protein [Lacticaseibacillus sp. NCIMB 15473]WNX25793.1 serine hydrolase domain-containing protein [Lacticaseibacillus casei]WNX28566.1 serine hydrolase domain-containing protein [Lacticaseibacillus casei]
MDFQAITAELQAWVAGRIIPGFSVALMTGKDVQSRVDGDAQWQPTPAPLRPGMLYDVASLTKVIGTTTVFLQAWDQKLVAPEMPLKRFLPAFPHATTFRQALTHTSGLEGYIPHRDDLPAPALKRALMTQLAVTDEVDAKVVYRDVNLLLVGWALEQIYHQPIQTLITQQVLRPLGLPKATFQPDPEQCVPTTYDPVAGLRRGVVHDPKSAILGQHSGAAGLFASLADLEMFTQYFFGQKQASAWPDHAQQLTRDWTAHQLGRSLGWDLRHDGQGRLWLYHTGYTGTFWLIQPQSQLALIVLTNRVHPQPNREFLGKRDQLVRRFLADRPDAGTNES